MQASKISLAPIFCEFHGAGLVLGLISAPRKEKYGELELLETEGPRLTYLRD